MQNADIFGYTATVIGLVTFTPQVVRAWKTKQTKDLSLSTNALLLAASLLWTVYGILNHAMPIIVANVVVSLHALTLIILKVRYK